MNKKAGEYTSRSFFSFFLSLCSFVRSLLSRARTRIILRSLLIFRVFQVSIGKREREREFLIFPRIRREESAGDTRSCVYRGAGELR